MIATRHGSSWNCHKESALSECTRPVISISVININTSVLVQRIAHGLEDTLKLLLLVIGERLGKIEATFTFGRYFASIHLNIVVLT